MSPHAKRRGLAPARGRRHGDDERVARTGRVVLAHPQRQVDDGRGQERLVVQHGDDVSDRGGARGVGRVHHTPGHGARPPSGTSHAGAFGWRVDASGHTVAEHAEAGHRHGDSDEMFSRVRRGGHALSSCLPRRRACDRGCGGETPGETSGRASIRRESRERGRGAAKSARRCRAACGPRTCRARR